VIGAAADSWGLQQHPHGHAFRTLDVVFDLGSIRQPGQQRKLVVGGEEFPVQKVAKVPTVDREQLGSGEEAEVGSDGIWVG
jgi:hypothetical protein